MEILGKGREADRGVGDLLGGGGGLTADIGELFHRFDHLGRRRSLLLGRQADVIGSFGDPFEKFDAVLAGWGWDYPDPFDFIDVLLNGNNIHETQNNNLAYFNVPAMNKKMDDAAKLVGDPRYKAYADLDVDITRNYAPWAAFLHRNERTFLSTRMDLKCFIFQPIYQRVDLGAECIK